MPKTTKNLKMYEYDSAIDDPKSTAFNSSIKSVSFFQLGGNVGSPPIFLPYHTRKAPDFQVQPVRS